MAQADRRYTGDMSVFSLESDSFLGTFKNVTIVAGNEMQESRAAKDAWRHRVTVISFWDVDLSNCVEVEASTNSLWEKLGDAVAFALTTDSAGGVVLTGTVIIRELSHAFATGEGQVQDAQIEGQGALTITYN